VKLVDSGDGHPVGIVKAVVAAALHRVGQCIGIARAFDSKYVKLVDSGDYQGVGIVGSIVAAVLSSEPHRALASRTALAPKLVKLVVIAPKDQ
jgi:hypothetical protein